jgi:hypothetical protein
MLAHLRDSRRRVTRVEKKCDLFSVPELRTKNQRL